MDTNVHPTCDNAIALVPSYLDGELSEAQAAPLRTHLLQCPACREVAKDLKGLKRWFVAEPPPAVPAGFAARVARRAFAGDPGLATPAFGAPRERAEGTLLTFVLRATAAAAALLLLLAAGLQLQARPTAGDELQAEDLDLVWEEIYGLDTALPAAPKARAELGAPAEKTPPAGPERR
jgi:anti-sigma factor RsiW